MGKRSEITPLPHSHREPAAEREDTSGNGARNTRGAGGARGEQCSPPEPPAEAHPPSGSGRRQADAELDEMLHYVRRQLAALVRAWPPTGPAAEEAEGAATGGAATAGESLGGTAAEGIVVDLADPLQHLAWQPRFREALGAHFRDLFEGAPNLRGADRLFERLAPACTWSMLFLISTLGNPRE